MSDITPLILDNQMDDVLHALVAGIPYAAFLKVHMERRGDELTGVMQAREMHIGNPSPPRLHGGATAGFMELTAIFALAWHRVGLDVEAGLYDWNTVPMPQKIPRTIDMTMDYLSPGRGQDTFARARINRMGRRYASVHVEAWQDKRDKLIAQATGHFQVERPNAPQKG